MNDPFKHIKEAWEKVRGKRGALITNEALMIVPYNSYSNGKKVILKGRVIENEGIVIKENASAWHNFKNNFKRLESDEAAHVKVEVQFKNEHYEVTTDEEGFFDLIIKADLESVQSGPIQWDTAMLKLPNHKDSEEKPITAEIKVLKKHEKTDYLIVSDIDDTILKTHVGSFLKLKMFYVTLFKNPYSRSAFDGIGKALQEVSKGRHDSLINPMFYLSKSPWNLYDLLVKFLHINEIPEGPLFLRDFGINRGEKRRRYQNHKTLKVNFLMNFYEHSDFVFIGDATEEDIDIYLEAYNHSPDRVIQIFIRETKNQKDNQRIKRIAHQNPEAPIHLISKSSEITAVMNQYNRELKTN